jgi:hypothetical protein
MNTDKIHILVAGWFSFEHMGTTAGDLIAKDIVCKWLSDAGISYDVALDEVFRHHGGIRWETKSTSDYSHIIFVCGPFGNGWPVTDLLEHFKGVKLIGINLSLLQSLKEWNPFHLIYPRDSAEGGNPDITFLGPPPVAPVVGVILAHKQKEYGERALHEKANEAIAGLIASREMSVVNIDTALENNKYNLRTPGEIESVIAKMDVVLTTRLHGTVLALKNGVPVIPIDPIQHGAKISEQVRILQWPVLFNAGNINKQEIAEAFNFCTTESAKDAAKICKKNATKHLEIMRNKIVSDIKGS